MIIDLVLCAVLVVSAIVAYKRGLLQSLKRLVSYLGAFYISYRFTAPVSEWIYQKLIRPFTIDKVKEAIFSGKAHDDGYAYLQWIKEAEAISKKAADVATYVVDNYLEKSILPVVHSITSLVLFVVSAILLSLILSALFRLILQSRPFRGIDSLAGLAVGFVEGLLLVALLASLLALFGSSLSTGAFAAAVKESRFVELASEVLLPLLSSALPLPVAKH